MELIPPADLLSYAGGDTAAVQEIADKLRDELAQDHALTRFYVRILHPAARAFEKVERRGVLVDVEKFTALSDELGHVIKAAENEAMHLLPAKMRIKYRDKIEKQLQQGKSPLLPSIMKEFFFTPHGLNLKPQMTTEKNGEPSMAKAHLEMFGDVPEAAAMVKVLKEMNGAAKTKSTFVDGFLKHLRPDGRFHPTYFLAHAEHDGQEDDSGTVTGRLSCKGPSFGIGRRYSSGHRPNACAVWPAAGGGGQNCRFFAPIKCWCHALGACWNGVSAVFQVTCLLEQAVVRRSNDSLSTIGGMAGGFPHA